MTIPAGPAGSPRNPWPKIVFAQKTDPGLEPSKQENEDSAHYQETRLGHLLVLCDGMGGHASGREASQAAIRTIFEHVIAAPPNASPGETLCRAVEAAGRAVYALGGTDNQAGRPGSTCVALLMHSLGTEIAHIGDSRIYVVRSGKIWPLTRDHSMVQELVDAGLLHKDDAAAHPDANKILKALGTSPEADVELRHDIVLQQARDVFLLVSDGVTDVIRDHDLLGVAAVAAETGQMAMLCEQVVQLANARGGPDNITVQAAMVTDAGLLPTAVATRPAPTPGMTVPDEGTRATSPGDRPPSTVRLPPPPSPAPTMPTPAPVAHAPTAPVRGKGATQKLAVVAAPQAEPPRPLKTIVDEPTVDSPSDDAPPVSSRLEEPKGRGAKVAIGLAMVVVGLVVLTISLRSLLYQDEAPTPLVDATAPAAAPTASSMPSAAPSASSR